MKYVGVLLLTVLAVIGCSTQRENTNEDIYSTKPYTRWWWFASKIDSSDVKYQLDWLKKNNFGGVEIAFVYPINGDTTAARFDWLSKEWNEAVTFAKEYASSNDLGCDFTFGTLWPFGDSFVPREEGTLFFGDSTSPKSIRLTWEHPKRGRVLNHLDKNALKNYSQRLETAFGKALHGKKSALFCDSWEVETQKLWTKGFDKIFFDKFGYDIKPYMDSLLIPGYENNFYDYMKVLSDLVLYNFYLPFTELSHKMNSYSRAQCGGSPTDLLTAFSLVDIPETEAILYEPNFARIPFSAAVLSNKNIISSETFTCIYGWKGWPGPGPYQGEEQTADLKLVADALFANGVNHIIWHGMPFNKKGGNNRFYASVHVGPDASFVNELPEFNLYLSKVSDFMRKGESCTDIAVYYPLEDSWMAVEYPDSLKFPWVWGEYELRYIKFNDELKGYQPVWINNHFLKRGKVQDGKLSVGKNLFTLLYVDVDFLDYETLKELLNLAEKGLPVCIKKRPEEPGFKKHVDYKNILARLLSFSNVSKNFFDLAKSKPLVEGNNLPEFICRTDKHKAYVFFANPRTKHLKYPMKYGQSLNTKNDTVEVKINLFGNSQKVDLYFQPYQSLLLSISKNNVLEFIDINFVPPDPLSNMK